MDNINLKDIQIKTLKNNKLLAYEEYSFIKCKLKDYSHGFYRKENSEWKPFIGVIVDPKMSYQLGVLSHKIVDLPENEISITISRTLGGGKWIQEERGSFLNLENEERDNIFYQINKFIDSPYLKYIKQHKDNFYYFSKDDINYDDLKNESKIFEPLLDLEEVNNLNKMKKVNNLKYKNYSLLPYLSNQKDKKSLDLLEKIFIYNPDLSFTLNFYKNKYNRNIILRYNLIYYYQTDDFKFKYLLEREMKNLKSTYLGKIQKVVEKQVRDYNLIKKTVKEINLKTIDLLDILLNSNIEFVIDIIKLNPKLFTSKETKKYIKTKTTMTNQHISSYLLKL
tara:strand:- start:1749 stop:2759 length:1011 start_codon:yes stop_codon:yes gene_type:complete